MQKTPLGIALFLLIAMAGLSSAWLYQGINYPDDGSKMPVVTPRGEATVQVEDDRGLELDSQLGDSPQPVTYSEPDVGITSVVFPISGKPRVNSHFGPRTDTGTGKREDHWGVDLDAKKGDSLFAIADGEVVKVQSETEPNNRCGNSVSIRSFVNGEYLQTRYCHAEQVSVRPGQSVRRGQVVATVGNTGNARTTGPHLHYELKRGRTPQQLTLVDPMAFHRSTQLAQQPQPGSLSDEQILATARSSPDNCVSLQTLSAVINNCANEYGINSNLLTSIMLTESGCTSQSANPLAVSSAGARGLVQLRTIAVEDVNRFRPPNQKINYEEIFKPSVNLCAGAHLVKLLCTNYGICNTDEALQAYNVGFGSYRNDIRNAAYVTRTRSFYSRLTSDAWPQTPTELAVDARFPETITTATAQGSSANLCGAVAVGDSITASGYYISKLNILCEGNFFRNAGVAGEGIAAIKLRFDDSIAGKKDAIILAGTNDLAGSADAIIANLDSLYAKAKTAGTRVIAVTIPPCLGYTSSFLTCNEATIAKIQKVNLHILSSQPTRVDAAVDVYSILNDGTGALRIEYDSGDNLHPNIRGGEAIGHAIYAAAYSTGECTQLQCNA